MRTKAFDKATSSRAIPSYPTHSELWTDPAKGSRPTTPHKSGAKNIAEVVKVMHDHVDTSSLIDHVLWLEGPAYAITRARPSLLDVWQ